MPETHCRILDSQDPRDLQQWLDTWAAWPQREVFAHPHYCDLYTDENSRALCALADINGYRVLYPFVMRDLTVEDYWPADVAFGYDLVSPYGYGGPFVWNSDAEPTPSAVANAFWASFGDWAAERNVVSEFIRFSLFPEMMLPYPGER